MKPAMALAMLPLLLSGCVMVPYPHYGYPHGNVSGRLVDRETRQPVAGIDLYLAGSHAVSDTAGAFAFTAAKARKLFVVIPLFPFDSFHPCSDTLRIRAPFREGGPRYRHTDITVASCRYSRLPGSRHDQKNPSLTDQLGIIELLPSPRPAPSH